MRKHILILFLLITFFGFSQSRVNFPYKAMLKNVKGNKVSSTTFYNFGKPIAIDLFAINCKPCIMLLDSFKEVYADWQKEYGVKIIVVVIDPKSKFKKAKKMIEEHQWPFEFYFDQSKRLYNKIQKGDKIPQTLIFDGEFNKVKHITGIEANFMLVYKKDTRSFEKRRITKKRSEKYSHLELDLMKYEETLKKVVQN